ncbi:MAG: hypothetical protein ABFS10_04860 [Bacteroidota bacterium]
MNRRKVLWWLIQAGVLVISVLVFTPVIIPNGKSAPELFHLPFTLWTGIIVYIVLIVINFVGVAVHSKIYKERDD